MFVCLYFDGCSCFYFLLLICWIFITSSLSIFFSFLAFFIALCATFIFFHSLDSWRVVVAVVVFVLFFGRSIISNQAFNMNWNSNQFHKYELHRRKYEEGAIATMQQASKGNCSLTRASIMPKYCLVVLGAHCTHVSDTRETKKRPFDVRIREDRKTLLTDTLSSK